MSTPGLVAVVELSGRHGECARQCQRYLSGVGLVVWLWEEALYEGKGCWGRIYCDHEDGVRRQGLLVRVELDAQWWKRGLLGVEGCLGHFATIMALVYGARISRDRYGGC